MASLQLDLILNSRSMGEIQKSLETLPTTLDRYYDLAWERINGHHDPRDSEYAKAALTWVVHAAKPLSSSELRHGVAAALNNRNDIENNLIDEEDIISLCVGLLTASRAVCGNIYFGHFSAVEYFHQRQAEFFPSADDTLTRACTRYLEYWLETRPAFEESLNSNTLSNPVKQDLLTETLIGGRAHMHSHSSRQRNLKEAYSPTNLDPEDPDLRYPHSGARFNPIRHAFNIDRSGLGRGRKLVLLEYAYDNVWFHARESGSAPEQLQAVDLAAPYPQLYHVKDFEQWIPSLRFRLEIGTHFTQLALGICHGLERAVEQLLGFHFDISLREAIPEWGKVYLFLAHLCRVDKQ